MGNLTEGKIGEKVHYAVEFKEGHLVAEIDFAVNGVEGKLEVKLGAEVALDVIAKAIPGEFDDKMLALLKEALKKVS